jgi:hypothetical protein
MAMPGVPDVAGTEVNQHPGKPHAPMKPQTHISHPRAQTDALQTSHTHRSSRHTSMCHIHINVPHKSITKFGTYSLCRTWHIHHNHMVAFQADTHHMQGCINKISYALKFDIFLANFT